MLKSDPAHPHRQKQKAAIRAANRNRFRTLLDQLLIQLGGVCSEPGCGATTTLQFAHLDPSTKLFNVADSSNSQISFARVIAEAAKCRLLCRRHHVAETRRQHADGSIRANKGARVTERKLGVQKTCSFCKASKDLSEFSPVQGSYGRQSACRDCLRAYTQRRVEENRAYVNSRKIACVVCGKTDGLEFDHVRGVKFKEVSAMLSYARSRIDAEIEKCDVVCPEHHMERTERRKRNTKKKEAR